MSVRLKTQKVKCPYCNWEQNVKVDPFSFTAAWCDPEGGGCEKLFVYRSQIVLDAVIKKVEGE